MVASQLINDNIKAEAYHSGLSNTNRKQILDDWTKNKINIVVATISFGMGIDKADVSFVIHYDMPKSIEGF